MGLFDFITIAYDIFSKTRNTKTRPLRSSGSWTVVFMSGTPVVASGGGAPSGRGESGTGETGFVSQFHFSRPGNQAHGEFDSPPSARSLPCVLPERSTTCPRW